MNSELTLEQGQLCISDQPEGLLSFLVSRSKSASRSLTPSASEVLRGCADAVNQILRTAIETRSRAEFDRIFNEEFPKYAALTLAISHFATAVIQKPLREQLVRESICEMEADFRDKGLQAFGSAVRDQAMFTVWTLRKINELTTQINATPVASGRKAEDREFCSNFNLNALRAYFNLDCLGMALDDQRAIYPEVQEELVDGLRAMVNAYTWARRGLEIRIPTQELLPEISPIDDEDAALMDLSFSEASEWLEKERGMDAVK
ncbi:MAG TPA: hypothetical protein VGG56_17150 [Terracidiphilus sp.]|jgi:hypothetical protein